MRCPSSIARRSFPSFSFKAVNSGVCATAVITAAVTGRTSAVSSSLRTFSNAPTAVFLTSAVKRRPAAQSARSVRTFSRRSGAFKSSTSSKTDAMSAMSERAGIDRAAAVRSAASVKASVVRLSKAVESATVATRHFTVLSGVSIARSSTLSANLGTQSVTAAASFAVSRGT